MNVPHGAQTKNYADTFPSPYHSTWRGVHHRDGDIITRLFVSILPTQQLILKFLA